MCHNLSILTTPSVFIKDFLKICSLKGESEKENNGEVKKWNKRNHIQALIIK